MVGSRGGAVARWPLLAVFALHAAFMALGAIQLALRHAILDPTPDVTSWLGLVHFERLIFLIGSALFMVVIARERLEVMTADAARRDALTGIANRGAFSSLAEPRTLPPRVRTALRFL